VRRSKIRIGILQRPRKINMLIVRIWHFSDGKWGCDLQWINLSLGNFCEHGAEHCDFEEALDIKEDAVNAIILLADGIWQHRDRVLRLSGILPQKLGLLIKCFSGILHFLPDSARKLN
jgi:hypothetical protein